MTDLLVLERFLGDGYFRRFARFDASSGFSGGLNFPLYSSAQEAERVIGSYLNDPPQLKHFRDGLKPVWNTVPQLSEHDSPWYVFDYDVQIDKESLSRLGENEGPLHSPD